MDGEWLGSRAIRCNWANQKGQPSIAQQQAMQSMQVDLTRYLVAQYQHPDRVIRIDNGSNGKPQPELQPQFHLHELVG